VTAIPGVREVKINRRAKEVMVGFDPAQVTEARIRAVIAEVNASFVEEQGGSAGTVLT